MKNQTAYLFKNLTDRQLDSIEATIYPNILKAMEEYASQQTAELEAELVALSDHNSTLIEERDELKPKWIKIESEEDLPKEGLPYYWVINHGVTMIAQYFSGSRKFFTTATMLHMPDVTHYMPIAKPQPPKED